MPDKNPTLTSAAIEAREQHASTKMQKEREEEDAGNTRDVDRHEPAKAGKTEKEDAQEYPDTTPVCVTDLT